MGSTKVQTAPPRDYAQETKDTLQTQINLAQQLYDSEAKFQPQYTELALQNAKTSLLGANGNDGLLALYQNSVYPTMDAISATSNTAQRKADINDVAALGPQLQEALRASNKELFLNLENAEALGKPSISSAQAALAAATQRHSYANLQAQNVSAQQLSADQVAAQQIAAERIGSERIGAERVDYNTVDPRNVSAVDVERVNAGNPLMAQLVANERIRSGNIQGGQLQQLVTNQALNAGASPLSQMLQARAMQALGSNGALTAQELRDSTQATRAAYAARGMGLNDQAIMGEVQNRLVNQRQRDMENMGLAGQINSQLIGEQQANRQFAQGALSQNVDVQSRNIANQLAAAQANQGSSLQAMLANQQMGLRAQEVYSGNSLQAALANQAAMQQSQLAAQNINADQYLRAALANQQAGLQAGQLNQSASLQASQANQDAALRAALANQSTGLQAQQSNQDASLRAALANQSSNLQAAQLNQEASLRAALANQGANLQLQQFNTGFNQSVDQQYLQNLGQLAQLQNQGTAADRAYAAQLVGLRQATVGDPFQAILGRPSQGFSAGAGTAGAGIGMQQLGGPALFNPESSYANNIYGGNQQAQNAANIASAQNKTAMITGAMSMAGGMMGCWVAREVYGNDNPEWRRFRTWLLTRAPRWFHNLYMKYGAQFAAFISNKPRLKATIRKWMDRRIATLAH